MQTGAFTSQEEVAPALGIEGTQSKAHKNDGGTQEGCHNDTGNGKEMEQRTYIRKRFRTLIEILL